MSYLAEDQIERRVERMIDAADRAYMHGTLSKDEYDRQISAIGEWADRRYSEAQALNRANLRRQMGVVS